MSRRYTPTALEFGRPPVDFERVLEDAGADLYDRWHTEQTTFGVRVELAELIPTQLHLVESRVRRILRDAHRGELGVTRLGGRLYLHDGHHHAAALLRLGALVAVSDSYLNLDST